jgi:hypothetical protein
LNKNDENVFEAYIKQAPLSAIINATYGEYQKFHRKDDPSTTNFDANIDNGVYQTMPNYFERLVPRGDPLYIERPKELRGRVGSFFLPENATVISQLQYKKAEIARDVRVSYYNPKYPWLEAVYRFDVTAYQPVFPDVAVCEVF